MILHTIVPESLIFQSSDEEYKKQHVVQYNGVSLLVQKTETHEYEIVRLLSSNPQHFLQAQYEPGKKLHSTVLTFL
jgi:L-rhamnose mutarotase